MPNAKDELRIALLNIVANLKPDTDLTNINVIEIAHKNCPEKIKSASDLLINIAMSKIINDALYNRKIKMPRQGDLFGKRQQYISVGKSRKRKKVGELSLIELINETKPKQRVELSSKNFDLYNRAKILIELVKNELINLDDAEKIVSENPEMINKYNEMMTRLRA
jgi:hypothetical protein